MTFATLLLKLAGDLCWYFALMRVPLISLPPLGVIIITALAVGYAAIVIYRWKKYDRRVLFEDPFVWQCIMLLVFSPFECLAAGYQTWEPSILLICLFLCFGVLLRRISRLGKNVQKDKRFWLWNVFTIAGATAVALVAASKTVRGWILAVVGFIYNKAVVPLVTGLGIVTSYVVNGIIWLLKKIFTNIDVTRLEENFIEMPEWGDEDVLDTTESYTGVAPWVKTVALILLIIALAALAFWAYKKLTSLGGKDASVEGISLRRESLTVSQQKKKRKKTEKSRSVRGYYRKFLRLCGKAGLEIEPQHSSAEIQTIAESDWDEEKLTPLRELYIKARYSTEPSTPEDISAAREAYKELSRRRNRKQ